REKLDILHVHYAMPHAISAILAREIASHPIKIVTTLHGTDITVLGYDKVFKKMIAYGLEQSDAVTAVSQSLVNETKSSLQIKKDISVIYNFVNEADYYKRDEVNLRQKYDIAPDDKVLIHISNFRKVKRIPDIVKAFHLVRKKVKSKLVFVGDGPELSTVIDLVNELNLQDDVLFLGKQKSISELLSFSDVKLLMSEKESFGLVLLEAMACKVPTIGTNIGGIPEVIVHGETGYVVELGDYEKASQYIIQMLEDDALRKELSHNAFERAAKTFHSDEILNQYIDLYKSLISPQGESDEA